MALKTESKSLYEEADFIWFRQEPAHKSNSKSLYEKEEFKKILKYKEDSIYGKEDNYRRSEDRELNLDHIDEILDCAVTAFEASNADPRMQPGVKNDLGKRVSQHKLPQRHVDQDRDQESIDYEEPDFELERQPISLTDYGELHSALNSQEEYRWQNVCCELFNHSESAIHALDLIIEDPEVRVDDVEVEETSEGYSVVLNYSVSGGENFQREEITTDWIESENGFEGELVLDEDSAKTDGYDSASNQNKASRESPFDNKDREVEFER